MCRPVLKLTLNTNSVLLLNRISIKRINIAYQKKKNDSKYFGNVDKARHFT